MANSTNLPIGKVLVVYGEVKAVNQEGMERVLTPNSLVFENERVITGADGSISIMFENGETQLELGKLSDVLLNEEVYANPEETDIADNTAEIAQIQQALESGVDPTQELEEPGAGPGAPGAGGATSAGGGRAIVEFTPDAMEVTPDSGAETTGLERDFLDPPTIIFEEEPGTPEPLAPAPTPAPVAAPAPAPPAAAQVVPPPVPQPPQPPMIDQDEAVTVSEVAPLMGDDGITASGNMLDNVENATTPIISAIEVKNSSGVYEKIIVGDTPVTVDIYQDGLKTGTLTVGQDGSYTYTLDGNANHELPGKFGENDDVTLDAVKYTVTDTTTGLTDDSQLLITIEDGEPVVNVVDKLAAVDNEAGSTFTGSIFADYGADGKATDDPVQGVQDMQLLDKDGNSLIGKEVTGNNGEVLTSGGEKLIYQDNGNGGVVAVTENGKLPVFTVELTPPADGKTGGSYTITMDKDNLIDKGQTIDYTVMITDGDKTGTLSTGDTASSGFSVKFEGDNPLPPLIDPDEEITVSEVAPLMGDDGITASGNMLANVENAKTPVISSIEVKNSSGVYEKIVLGGTPVTVDIYQDGLKTGTLTVAEDGSFTYDLDSRANHKLPEKYGEDDAVTLDAVKYTVTDTTTGLTDESQLLITIEDGEPVVDVIDKLAAVDNESGSTFTGSITANYGADGKATDDPAQGVQDMQLLDKDGNSLIGKEVTGNNGEVLTSGGEKLIYQDNGNGGVIAVTESGKPVFTVELTPPADGKTDASYTITMDTDNLIDKGQTIDYTVMITDGDETGGLSTGDTDISNLSVKFEGDNPLPLIDPDEAVTVSEVAPLMGDDGITASGNLLDNVENATTPVISSIEVKNSGGVYEKIILGGTPVTVDIYQDGLKTGTLTVAEDGSFTYDLDSRANHKLPEKYGEDDAVTLDAVKYTVTDTTTGLTDDSQLLITIEDGEPEVQVNQNAILVNEGGNSVKGCITADYGADGKAIDDPGKGVQDMQLLDKDGNSLIGQEVADNNGKVLTSGGEKLIYQDNGNGGVIAVTENGKLPVFTVEVTPPEAGKTTASYTVTLDENNLLDHDITTEMVDHLQTVSAKDLTVDADGKATAALDGNVQMVVTGVNSHGKQGSITKNDNGMGIDAEKIGGSEQDSAEIDWAETISIKIFDQDDNALQLEGFSFDINYADDQLTDKNVVGVEICDKNGDPLGDFIVDFNIDGNRVDIPQDLLDKGATEIRISGEGTPKDCSFTVDNVTAKYSTEEIASDTPQSLEYTVKITDGDVVAGESTGDTDVSGVFTVTFNGDNNIEGTDASEAIAGGQGADTISGNGGNDAIYANGGDDVIDGGDGNDVIVGGDGEDTISGGTGDDTIVGGNDTDTITTDEGNDTVVESEAGSGEVTDMDAGDVTIADDSDTVNSLLGGDNICGG